jgi:hypothetical protein
MLASIRSGRQGRGPGIKAVVSVLAAFALVAGYSPPATAAASVCSTTTGPTGYTVQACLAPSAGVVSGTISPTLTVTTSTTAARPSFATFCLDGTLTSAPSCVSGGAGYLLRDFKAQTQPNQTTTTWSFSMATAHWIDGAHTLLAVVTMRDGTQSSPVVAPLSFVNGNRSQPVNSTLPTIHTGTVPPKGAPLIVAAVGDGSAGDSASHSVASLVSSWKPNLFLYLGDVYQNGSYLEFTNWYDTTFGSLRSITDPVPGNHEYISRTDPATASTDIPAGVAYFDYWDNLPHFYSFDAGTWHFIALDANQSPMGGTAWKAQLAWLATDLAAHPTGCTLVYWHQPAYNVGTEPIPNSARILWGLVAGHATFVLNGHDHTYQRWTAMTAAGAASPAGTVELIDGTGGHSAGAFAATDARVLGRSTNAGALRLTLGPTSAGVQFVTSSGSVLDSTTVPCH